MWYYSMLERHNLFYPARSMPGRAAPIPLDNFQLLTHTIRRAGSFPPYFAGTRDRFVSAWGIKLPMRSSRPFNITM
jgi:hypothetical protein